MPSATRSTDRLSDRGIRAWLAARRAGDANTKKLSDGGGLYLAMTPAGSAVWRVKYRHAGREKLLALGIYPEVGLAAARAQRNDARATLREGHDPGLARQIARATAAASDDSTFGGVASAWLEKSKVGWSDVHYEKSLRAFERDVLPALGHLPIAQVSAPMIVAVLRPIVARGARETAGRVLQHIGGVFRYAEGLGLVDRDPSAAAREVLPRAPMPGRLAALLDLPSLRDLLRRANVAPLSPPIRMAHRLCAFTAARIGNVVEAEWSEFTLDDGIPAWTIPRAKMKSKDKHHDHRILLGPTIAAELRTWRELTGGEGYLFRSPMGNAHITREGIERAYSRTLGMLGKHTPHGWRAAFSTLARDAGFGRDVVELTLDHIADNAVARAYDRGERLQERQKLMTWWDEQLTGAST